MDISIYVKRYLCSNLDNLDKYLSLKVKYNNKVLIIRKILKLLTNIATEDNHSSMITNLKINHFLLELEKLNKKYNNDFMNLNEKFYNQKKKKFLIVTSIFKDYILNYLDNIKEKNCNEYLLYNLLLEKNLEINITKFNKEKFIEIVNLTCEIISKKKYLINYT